MTGFYLHFVDVRKYNKMQIIKNLAAPTGAEMGGILPHLPECVKLLKFRENHQNFMKSPHFQETEVILMKITFFAPTCSFFSQLCIGVLVVLTI